MSNSNSEPIAVVGIAFRLPGGIHDEDGLWESLQSGRPVQVDLPADQYIEEINSSRAHGSSTKEYPNKRDFDHKFFQFSRLQAAQITQQERLLLELSYEALENGGITLEKSKAAITSVFAVNSGTKYEDHIIFGHCNRMNLSNRISHALHLCGASVTLHEESDGLAALHLAYQSLLTDDSDISLVAASYPSSLSTESMRPFNNSGEKKNREEAAVVLALKRLDAAIWDHNPIQAVIGGTAIGYLGNPQRHDCLRDRDLADMIRKTYFHARIGAEKFAYVETHGDAPGSSDFTNHGVYFNASPFEGAGHGGNENGLTSLLKAIVMLQREPLLSAAGSSKLMHLEFINTQTNIIPWPKPKGNTPRACVYNFNVNGDNAYVILERGLNVPQKASAQNTASPHLFTLSANSPASLVATVKAQRAWVERCGKELPITDLSYTLRHHRSALPYRFSAVAGDRGSLLDEFTKFLTGYVSKPVPLELDVVGIFTGQGAQWAGMARELLLEKSVSSIFRGSILISRDILHKLGATWDLKTELLRDANESRLGEAELAQPVTTAIQIALIALTRSQGLRFRAVMGHSNGEIGAAYAAGFLSHETALKISFHSGFLATIAKSKGLCQGAMLSVGLGKHDVDKYLDNLARGKVMVACVNSPHSVTIAGDIDAIDEVQHRITLAEDGTFHRKVLVDTAYHSHHMAAVADDYKASLGNLGVQNSAASEEEVAFVSSVTGQVKRSGFDAEYWVDNIVSPVRFEDAFQTLVNEYLHPDRHIFFVEIGPHPALLGPIRQCLQREGMPEFSFDYHAPLQRNVTATTSALKLTGKLFERGVDIHWDGISALSPNADKVTVLQDLPSYPWDRDTCGELNWHTDIDHIRMEDLPLNPCLTDIATLLALKQDTLSILGLGLDIELSEELLIHFGSDINKIASFDFVHAAPGLFDEAAERLKGFPVRFRALRLGTDPTVRGFVAGSYDFVLTTSTKWLDQAASLVKATGKVVMVLESEKDLWRTMLKTSPPLEELLTFYDKINGRSIVILKVAHDYPVADIQIFTSAYHTPLLVSVLEKELNSINANVSVDILSTDSVGKITSKSGNTIVVIDDNPGLSILFDSASFDTVTSLLTSSSHLVWIGRSGPLSYQIDSMSRTAELENRDLQLTIIRAASKFLTSENDPRQLARIVRQVAEPGHFDSEREYQIYANGTVLIPRLHCTKSPAALQDNVAVEASPIEQSFEQWIASGNTDAAGFISCAIMNKLSQLLSVQLSRIDGIMSLGLDSLVAFELRSWILKEFDASLQSSEILANQTAQLLADKVVASSKMLTVAV